jgi:hypothetical protein
MPNDVSTLVTPDERGVMMLAHVRRVDVEIFGSGMRRVPRRSYSSR